MSELLPNDLPISTDDGACSHLVGQIMPDIVLSSTDDSTINLQDLNGRLVIYCYPMTGTPGVNAPDGWDEIPGARGCTSQACSFRDHYNELQKLNADVFGVSTQTTNVQKEAKQRLHLPYELLSDRDLLFSKALRLPYFFVEDIALIKRITLIFEEKRIIKYFYPVFPPDKNIDEVINWLKIN